MKISIEEPKPTTTQRIEREKERERESHREANHLSFSINNQSNCRFSKQFSLLLMASQASLLLQKQLKGNNNVIQTLFIVFDYYSIHRLCSYYYCFFFFV